MSKTKRKIALVEDEKDLAEIYSLRLKMDGFDTVVITDSTEALAALKQELPDLVLLDIMMPVMDGFELFGLMKQDKKLEKIKVYVWSNLTQKKDQDRAKKMKIDGFLIKSDYTPATLSKKVQEILK